MWFYNKRILIAFFFLHINALKCIVSIAMALLWLECDSRMDSSYIPMNVTQETVQVLLYHYKKSE